MRIAQITDLAAWEKFVQDQPYTLFTQSTHYADFHRSMGEQGWIWGAFDDNDQLILGTLVISVHARRGNFLFIPYGPVWAHGASPDSVSQAGLAVLEELKKFGRAHNYHFIRTSPFTPDLPETQAHYKEAGFRDAPIHMLAEHTWLLDLQPTEGTLLADMEKNHRNLIRRCQKEGVRVEFSSSDEAVADFNRLHDITAARHKFHRFSRSYISQEFAAFAPTGQAVVGRAYLADGTLDSAAIFMYYGTMSAYRHGASLMTDKKIPTSYLLQWEAIRRAQEQGMRWHNFWGIAPDGAPATHPFYGITHFKKGFGGQPYPLLHCQDFPLSWRYWPNWIVETVRSIRRGFK